MTTLPKKFLPILIAALFCALPACRYGLVSAEKGLGELEFPEVSAAEFGEVFLGFSRNVTVVVRNRRTAEVRQIEASFNTGAEFSFTGGNYPGAGGTCGESLSALNTCTVVMTYTPVATGDASDLLRLRYYDGEELISLTLPLYGSSVTVSSLTFSAATFDFGNTALSSTAEGLVTLTNQGQTEATAISASTLSAPFGYLGGSYPGTGGTCGTSLAAGESCTIVPSYSPTGIGPSSIVLAVSYQNGNSTDSASISISGTGALGVLEFSDGPTFDYGAQFLGTTTDKTFTLSNTGAFALSGMQAGTPPMASPYAFKGGAYPGTGGTCTATLASGNSCTVVVTFSPIVTGAFNSSLTINYSNGQSTQNGARAITGSASKAALLSLSDGLTFDFGAVFIGRTSDKTLTVINSGENTATALDVTTPALAAPFSFKDGSYPGTGGTCGTSLAPALSCTIVVTFAPTAGGTFGSTVWLGYHSGLQGEVAGRGLSGTAASNATLVFDDSPLYDFGAVAVSQTGEAALTILNGGGTTATAMAPSAALVAPFAFKGGVYPGIGGTCGTSLAAGDSCIVVVTFSPVAESAFSDTLALTYHDGLATLGASLPIAGDGELASLSLSDGPTHDFGSPAVGSTNEKALTVSNDGGVGATAMAAGAPVLAPPYAFKGGSYPGTGGTCGATLAAGSQCAIVVVYTPTLTGVTNDTVRVSYHDGQASQTANRALTGMALTPASLSVSDGPTFDFGTSFATLSVDHTFVVTNSGESSATGLADGGDSISAPYTFKDGTYPGTGGTCGATLAAGATCSVVVTFAPTTQGTFNDTLTLQYHDGAALQSAQRNVTGVSLRVASLAISESPSFSFGSVYKSSTSDKTFTVTNSGDVTATSFGEATPLSAPFSFLGGTYPGTGGTCGTDLSASASCTIVVRFAPTALGAASDTVSLTYHNGLSTQTATRSIGGTGVLASLTLSASPLLDFGSQAVLGSYHQSVTVTNGGGGAATSLATALPALAAPFSYRGGGYPGTGGTCGTTLSAGSSCTVVYTFAPTASGVASDTANLSYFDGESAQSLSLPLTGTGVTAVLTISDGATYNFGTVFVSSTSDKTFTVTNGGTGSASSMAQGTPALAAPYTFKGGSYPGTGGTCGTTLAAGDGCTIVVTFAPTSTGTFNSTVTLAYSDGVTSTSATRPMTGTGAAVASLVISDGTTYSFGNSYLNVTSEKSFTVTNSGGASASSMAGASLSSGYAFKGGSYPGTGGTCGTTLGTASTCTVVVTFTPTGSGTLSQNLVVTYHDGQQSTSAIRPMTGVGVVPAVLSISDGPTYNYGETGVGNGIDKSFTVTNTGPTGATAVGAGTPALGADYAFKGGSYPGTGGTCGVTLAASGTCSIVVTFTPSTEGLRSDTIVLAFHDGVATTGGSRAVQGTGADHGTLDETFGSSGLVNVGIGSGNDHGRAVQIQSDGKILVAGYAADGSLIDSFALTRLTSAGVLDTTFDTDGKVTTTFGTLGDRAYAMAVQNNGRIVLAGYSDRGGGDVDFAVARYLTTGALDTQFGTGGKVTTSFGSGDDRAQAIAIQSDGKIVVAGYSEQPGTLYDLALVRYHTDGTLDTTFGGGDGMLTADLIGAEDRIYAMAVQSDGNIVVAGTTLQTVTNSVIMLARFDSAGDFDPGFNGVGFNFINAGSGDDRAFAVKVQGDGAIVAAGYTQVAGVNYDFAAIRVDSSGALDSGFGSGGIARVTPGSGDDRVHAIAIQSTGKIVLAGYRDGEGGNSSFALARLDTNGTLDTTFGTDGQTATALSSNDDKIYGLGVDSSLNLIAVGEMHNGSNSDFALAKYWP